MDGCHICLIILACIIAIIFVSLIAASFSRIEYYDYGLKQHKTTGRVDTSKVYTHGRYFHGPSSTFITYPADAQFVRLVEHDVFSKSLNNESIGLAFELDIDFTYLLIQDEVGLLHQELASSYHDVIESRAKEAIKNDAIFISFNEYFQAREDVEDRFAQAVRTSWASPPSVHCTLDQFYLKRIRIPDSVADKQLQATIQFERNEEESYLQEAQIEREMTKVQVNTINLEEERVLRTAGAEADLTRARAHAEAEQITTNARTNGTRALLQAANITTQEHLSTFNYIRMLANRKELHLDISHLDPDNVLRTQEL